MAENKLGLPNFIIRRSGLARVTDLVGGLVLDTPWLNSEWNDI